MIKEDITKEGNYTVYSPTPIITTPLKITESYRQKCIDEIYKLGDQMDQSTNVKAQMSWWNIWETTPQFNKILDNSLKAINHYFPDTDTRYEYKLSNAWTALYQNHHHSLLHDHIPYTISFIYYLQADKDSSPLEFPECGCQIAPETDMLVMFRSHIKHKVPPQKSGKDRILLAGNVSLELIKK